MQLRPRIFRAGFRLLGNEEDLQNGLGIEQSFVLEGTLVDDDGACTAGNYVWRRIGSVHEAWSPDGCIVLGIFDKPNEFLA